MFILTFLVIKMRKLTSTNSSDYNASVLVQIIRQCQYWGDVKSKQRKNDNQILISMIFWKYEEKNLLFRQTCTEYSNKKIILFELIILMKTRSHLPVNSQQQDEVSQLNKSNSPIQPRLHSNNLNFRSLFCWHLR